MKITIRNDEDTVGLNVLVKKVENGSPAPEVSIPPAGEHDFEIHEGGFLTVTTLKDGAGTAAEAKAAADLEANGQTTAPTEEPPAGKPAEDEKKEGEEAQS